METRAQKAVRARTPVTQTELDEILRRHEMYLAARPGGQRALFAYRDLSGFDLHGRALGDADFTAAFMMNVRLAGANLTGATLFGANLTKADLANAVLSRADMRGAVLRGANLSGADLFDADLRDGRLALKLRSGELQEIALEDEAPSDLVGATLTNANLSQARLSGAIAMHTDFTDAVMRHCKLVRADLRNAIMNGVNLEGADLSGADLRGASLRDAILTGTVLASAEIEGAKIVGALTDAPAGRPLRELPEPIETMLRRHERWAASGGAEGSPIDLSDFDLRATPSLAGACLSAMRAERAVFFGLALDGVGLQAGQLQGADFRCCRMARADLRGVNLKLARLTNADLRDCNLGPLTLPGNRSIVSMLEGAEMRHADLRGANLRQAVLSRADLSSANLTGAQTDGAKFNEAKLAGTMGLG